MRSTNPADECFETALAVIERGWASVDQLRSAHAWRYEHRPRLGKLAMSQGQLTVAQVFAILREQAVSGALFGELAVQLGFLDRGSLYGLLQEHARLTPTLLDALVAISVISTKQADFIREQCLAGDDPEVALPAVETASV